jgi:hypothetical protein
MNERIQKLIEQATSTQGPTPYNPLTFEVFDKEKFAELIVRECVNWIDGSPTTEEGTLILSKSFIIANLKQHFGVEE